MLEFLPSRLTTVVWQVVTKMDAVRMRDGLPLEVALTQGLRHQGIMATIRHAEHLRRRGNGSLVTELWLLLEYCDKGSLVVRDAELFCSPCAFFAVVWAVHGSVLLLHAGIPRTAVHRQDRVDTNGEKYYWPATVVPQKSVVHTAPVLVCTLPDRAVDACGRMRQ